MKNKFKLLCILLSLVVICSALIISVSANENYGIASYVNNKGETAEASFEDAMLRAKPGTTVTLLGDCSFSSAFYVNKRLELDLNGYTLKSTAENAFIFEEAYSLTVKGSGVIDIEGKLVHSQTPSLDFKFTVWGTEGTIDINHSGSLSPKIAETLGGILTFRNVDITSISAGGSNIDAFFYVGANAKGANILFDSMTFYCDKNPTIQNQYIFLLLGGTDTYAKIYNSTILNGGTLLYYGFNNAKNADTVLTDIENSHLEVISQNNSVRSVLIWCHLQDGGNIELYGTVNLKNSYIGGNVYRAVHSNNQEINSLNGKSYGYDRFKVILDNSIIANNGANDADATKKGVDQDTLITRGALVYLKNGSVLVSGNASLQNGGQIKAEEGTRFNTTVVANSEQITWVDANGSDIKKPQIALDIKGNLTYPVIASNDAIDSALAGASSAEFYTMSYASGFGSNSDYGYHVDTNSINGGLTEHSTITEAVPKRGAFTSVTYGNNTAFKYWISPNAEYSLGDIEKLTTDPLFILGDDNLYSGKGYGTLLLPSERMEEKLL